MTKIRKENLNPISLASDTIGIWQIRFWRIIFLCAIVAIPGSMLGVVEIDSTSAPAVYNLGNTYYILQNYNEAEKYFENSI